MKSTIKKSLLIGTAIVAVGAFSTQAQAADLTLGANGSWGSAGGANSTPTTDVTNAAASDNVDVTAAGTTLTVINTAGFTDGTGANAFVLGAVTDSGVGVASVVYTGDATADANSTATFGSAVIDGSFAVTGADLAAGDLAATVTGALTTGTTLSVLSDGNTQANTSALTVGGALTVGTTATVTAGAFAGASTAALTVTGNSAFTGGIIVTGGANALALSTLTLNGATNTGAITLTDGGGASENAKLVLSGTAAQTVAGVVAGDGDITVNNANGVTFNGTTAGDTLLVAGTAANSAATLAAGSTVAAITLGDGLNTDTNTLTLDGTTAGFTAAGTIDGTAGDTDNVVVSGGNTIITSGIIGAGGGATVIDSLTVSGTGTELDANAAIDATTVTVNTGATLDLGAALTGAVTVSGTVNITGGAGITGTVTGASGTLDVDATSAVTGAIAGLDAIDVATGATLTAGGAVGATTTTLNGTGALSMTAGNNLTTNVVVDVDGNGTINIADAAATTAISGNIGTSAKALGTLNVDGTGSAMIVTTTGNLYVDAIVVDDAATTLQFLGTSAQTVSGTLDGGGAGEGILTVGNGTTTSNVTFGGIVGGTTLASATVSANATARFDAAASFAGAFTNTGTTNLGVASTLTTVGYTGAGTLGFDMQDADASGTVTAGDNGTVADAATVVAGGVVKINFLDNTAVAGTYTLGDFAAGSTFTGTDNSIQFGTTFAVDGAGDLTTTVTKSTIASLASNSATTGVAAVLDTLAATTNTQLVAINSNLASAPTQDAFNEVLEATTSTVDGGAVVAAMGVSNQTSNITNTRLASLRSGDASTGMSAGNSSSGLHAWGQAFGTTADQDDRDGIDGYDADTYGLAVGLDTAGLHDDMVVGLALTYADTDVDSDNATTTSTEVDSYQITLYGDYDVDDRTYVSGQLAYSFGDVDTTRHNVGGVAGLNASGDYDSDQFSTRLEAGRSYNSGNGMTLTPSVNVNYVHYDADDYTETGAGGANLTVDNDTLNILELGVGVEASWENQNADGSILKPTIHAGVRHDVIGDEVESTNTFVGGGSAFKTEGFDPAQTTFNGGVGVTYYSTNNWNFTANYDGEYKSDYSSHSGLLKAGYKF